jgi:hypothetical protein
MKLLRNITLGKTHPNRRQLLKALGLSPLAYKLMPTLNGYAQNKTPLRLLLTFTSSGVVPEQWYPTGSETDWSFPTGGSTAGLNKHKSDIIFFKGLKRGAAGGGGHEASTGGVWTGNSCISSVAQAASVDQIIAKNIPKQTDFQSYQFGVMCFYAGEGDITSKRKNNNPYIIHAGPAQKIESQCDPYKVFDQLFANLPMGGGAGPDPNMERLRAERRSILDALKGEFSDLELKVGREDRIKVSSHLDSVREIERRLDSGGPRMIGAIPRPEGGIALDRSANYEKLIPIMNRLVVAALASDRTRIASLQYSRGFSQVRHTWVGARDAHHTISHIEGQKVTLAKIQGWYCDRFSELFDMMKAVPEGDGNLLDNTLVAYSNELALGWTHGVDPAATYWVTGAKGRAGGKLKASGRFLDYSGQFDYNQMLQTLCHVMGATSVNKVGDFGKPGIIAPLLA